MPLHWWERSTTVTEGFPTRCQKQSQTSWGHASTLAPPLEHTSIIPYDSFFQHSHCNFAISFRRFFTHTHTHNNSDGSGDKSQPPGATALFYVQHQAVAMLRHANWAMKKFLQTCTVLIIFITCTHYSLGFTTDSGAISSSVKTFPPLYTSNCIK